MPSSTKRAGRLERIGRAAACRERPCRERHELQSWQHAGLRIPHATLQPETLRALIESFVLREGTEYGEREISLDAKVAAVTAQLDDGRAIILYDAESETCTIAAAR